MPEFRDVIPGSQVSVSQPSLAGLQAALAAGTLSSAALTGFYLQRIERLNPALHAVITVNADAPDEAAASDAARAVDGPRGPLEGIPVLVKDNVQVAGMPTTAGSPALLSAEPGDAFLVERLRAAGAVIIGKANLSEWANFRSTHSTSGWSTLGGQTANPYALDRNPSGSSSGSAAGVAAGLAPLSVGTETDGSIVSPASACGIVGMKPTLGLVSRSGIVPITPEQDTVGPMTMCVADAAALLDGLIGSGPADEATQTAGRMPAPDGGYTSLLDPGALDGARIGVWRDGSAAAGPASVTVLDAAIARLRACGAQVTDPVELPDYAQIGEPELACLRHEFKAYLNEYLAAAPGEHPGTLAELIAYNSKHAATVQAVFGQELFEQSEATSGDLADPVYRAARADARRLATAALDSALVGAGHDAVVALSSSPAWLTDHILGDHHVFGTAGPPAVAGYPSVTVPAGWVSGLPVGLTFMGPAWGEARLLALAYAFEQSAG